MRSFMHERGKFFVFGLAGQNRDATTLADTKRGRDVRVIDKLNPSAFEECGEALDVLSGIACHLVQTGKLYAVGLEISKT